MNKVPTTVNFSVDPRDRENNPFWDPIFHATRVLLGFAQGIFKSLPKGMYHWDSDPESTEILITDQSPITLSVINHRPAIVTIKGQSQFSNLALNSFQAIDPYTGNKTFRDMIGGSVTFNCLSRTGIEANRIAWFLGSHVKYLRAFLQRQGPFSQIGHEVIIGGESPPGMILQDPGEEGTINVPVIVPFYFPHRWEVEDPTFSLAAIEANIYERIVDNSGGSHAGLEPNVGPDGGLKPPNVHGVPIIPGPSVPLRTRVTVPNE